tara:strand:- start:2598 stop:3014 length:417 start_codon:yes stop_codon:yes gene_type:complete
MSEVLTPEWRYLKNFDDLDKLVEFSNQSAVILFRYNQDRKKDHKLKKTLDSEWSIKEQIPAYILDDSLVGDLSGQVCNQLEVDDISPIILLLIEGEVIYEEYDEITAKKIQLAVKIVERTFKWMKTRKQKKAPGKPKA